MNYANNADAVYLELCKDILANGAKKEDRTGTGTRSVFGRQLRFDLSEGFPLLTTKKTAFRLIAQELLFFVRGETNLKALLDVDVDIWTRDGYAQYCRECEASQTKPLPLDTFRDTVASREHGYDLGPIYGSQWREWRHYEPTSWHAVGIDQLQNAIDAIKEDPDSRRMIVSAWNPAELHEMALPPCHVMYQFYVADGVLSLQMYQRSADVFLGLPFNIASYALLLEMVAAVTGTVPGELVITIGDAHIYDNHVHLVEQQIEREGYELPALYLWAHGSIDEFTMNSFVLDGYQSCAALRGEQSF